jgi:hypothetical protein
MFPDGHLGFLSGIGFTADGDPLAGMDAEGVWSWVDNYCRAHPIEKIAKAAAEFDRIHPSDRPLRPTASN